MARAEVRALAQQIACDLHPLNNLRVLRYLVEVLGTDDAQKQRWYAHWTQEGLAAFESTLARTAGMYCVGDTVSLADVCLVPQVFNARRFDVDLAAAVTAAGELEDVLLGLSRHTGEEPDPDRILAMQRLKTAHYTVGAPLRAGALLAGADPDLARAMGEATTVDSRSRSACGHER